VYSSTIDDFIIAKENLFDRFPKCVKYIQRWIDRAEKWSDYTMKKKFTLEIQSSQLAESCNKV